MFSLVEKVKIKWGKPIPFLICLVNVEKGPFELRSPHVYNSGIVPVIRLTLH